MKLWRRKKKLVVVLLFTLNCWSKHHNAWCLAETQMALNLYNNICWERVCCCCCCKVASVVSDSVRPHRLQPTRLCCPWDSPLEWVVISFSKEREYIHIIFITVCCFNCSILLAIVNLVLCVIYKLNFVIAMYVISQLVKNPPVRQKTLVWFLGWEALLDKG